MPSVDWLTRVTLAIFVAGLIWDASRKSEQLRELRTWRKRADRKLDRIMVAVGAMPPDDDNGDDE